MSHWLHTRSDVRVQFWVLIVLEGQSVCVQGVHAVAPLDAETFEPNTQGVQTLSDVVVQLALRYVPAGQGPEQDKHCVAPLVLEKLKPAKQGVHTLSDVVVQAALKYVPGEHKLVEQGKHCEAPLVKEKLEPAVQFIHTLRKSMVAGPGRATLKQLGCRAPLLNRESLHTRYKRVQM